MWPVRLLIDGVLQKMKLLWWEEELIYQASSITRPFSTILMYGFFFNIDNVSGLLIDGCCGSNDSSFNLGIIDKR